MLHKKEVSRRCCTTKKWIRRIKWNQQPVTDTARLQRRDETLKQTPPQNRSWRNREKTDVVPTPASSRPLSHTRLPSGVTLQRRGWGKPGQQITVSSFCRFWASFISRTDMSCDFMSCHLIRQFHVLHFHVRHYQRPPSCSHFRVDCAPSLLSCYAALQYCITDYLHGTLECKSRFQLL